MKDKGMQFGLFDFMYEAFQINFEFKNGNLMIDATAMAKVFGKEINNFMVNDSTKNFINSCLKTRNSGFLNVKTKEDLVISKQKSGTWMHKTLAIYFAMWLNPDFAVWVCATIEQILTGYYKEQEHNLKASAKLLLKHSDLQRKLKATQEYQDLMEVEREQRKLARQRGKYARKQQAVYEEMFRQKKEDREG